MSVTQEDVLTTMAKIGNGHVDDVTTKDIKNLIRFVEKKAIDDPDFAISDSSLTMLKPPYALTNIFYAKYVRGKGKENFAVAKADLTFGTLNVYSPLFSDKVIMINSFIVAHRFVEFIGYYLPETEFDDGLKLIYNCKQITRYGMDTIVLTCSDSYGSSKRYFILSDFVAYAIHIEGKHIMIFKAKDNDTVRAINRLLSI